MWMEKVTKAFKNLKIRKTGINMKSFMDNVLQIWIPTLSFLVILWCVLWLSRGLKERTKNRQVLQLPRRCKHIAKFFFLKASWNTGTTYYRGSHLLFSKGLRITEEFLNPWTTPCITLILLTTGTPNLSAPLMSIFQQKWGQPFFP